MAASLTDEEMVFHALFIGATGAGKTNALLYWLRQLFTTGQVALVLIDPHGDAAIELASVVPDSELRRVAMLDPSYVTFGLNPLSLPKGFEDQGRPQVLQRQAEELSILFSDVFNTDAANAPRLMWIFKGALYYLYTLSDDPTFKDLYHILTDFISRPKEQIERMLRSKGLQDEIIASTIDAISKLPKDAFSPVINRISNFVLPPKSITSRTFCSRTTRLDLDEMLVPGRLTIFRIPKTLPFDFRRLISASIVMKFYFAVEKRALRLELSGEAPSARTPVVLAVDEFQNISDLKLLDTILSQSRKDGLYLWMVNQNVQQIRQDLFSSIAGNVGPVHAFRVGPEDAGKLAELLSPRWKDEVRKALVSLPDYTCIVRKRLHGEDVGDKPLLLEPFPKLRDPVRSARNVIDYMKSKMEEKYGGAHEAADLVYRGPFDPGDEQDGSRVPFMPIHWRILTTGYLKLFSDADSLEFSRLRTEFYTKYTWTTTAVQQALNELVNAGYLTLRFQYQSYVMMGKDAYGNPIMLPPDPKVADQMDRAKTIIYNLTPPALELFQVKVGPTRVGDPKHVRMIEKLLKEEYWPMGHYCIVDWGETGGERPDIAVLTPSTIMILEKGRKDETRAPDPNTWDYSSVTAVEVEMSPGKNSDQVKQNYRKNVGGYAKIRFVVTTESDDKQVRRILSEINADPAKYRVDKIDFESLNVISPGGRQEPTEGAESEHDSGAKAGAQPDGREEPGATGTREEPPRPTVGSENNPEQPRTVGQVESGQPLGTVEKALIRFILDYGFTSREDLVERCSQAGMRISARSVSRRLKFLTEKGFLKRTGNVYTRTEMSEKASS